MGFAPTPFVNSEASADTSNFPSYRPFAAAEIRRTPLPVKSEIRNIRGPKDNPFYIAGWGGSLRYWNPSGIPQNSPSRCL